ncbi:hypothetical protein [Sphingomonas sp.]|jgi:hypothetical protein|uniref:hypothetical protein n=1 Tax=Sphingomonas sp. TaxID=28214 RepID=UPI002E2EB97E|nr:hypothetical protein [Sphingomonas sp.]HEX4693564.1 hypothetical protein [Sphingomonas sp.]
MAEPLKISGQDAMVHGVGSPPVAANFSGRVLGPYPYRDGLTDPNIGPHHTLILFQRFSRR